MVQCPRLLGFAFTCALAVTMIATMLLGSLLVKRAPEGALPLPDAATAARDAKTLRNIAFRAEEGPENARSQAADPYA